MQVDNRKVMGEALKEIRRRLIAPYLTEDQFRQFSPNKPLVDIIDSALAKEPRNCDKGSCEEQYQRFQKWCWFAGHKQDFCFNKSITCNMCYAKWMNEPYECGCHPIKEPEGKD